MNMPFRSLAISAVVVAATFTVADAQLFRSKDGYKLQVEFVQEPPCPVKISVKNVELDRPPESQSILLQIENTSSTSIRAFAMISGGNVHPNLHTITFPTVPFEAGKTIYRGIWPNSQEHYYFFFDYILFTDGSVCGLDNHHRSIQIASYLEARQIAMARLRELASQYQFSDEIITEIEKDGSGRYASMDNPGPPNPETIKLMPRRAWEHVVARLRRLTIHQKEAAEIANKLESEMPKVSKDPGR